MNNDKNVEQLCQEPQNRRWVGGWSAQFVLRTPRPHAILRLLPL